MVLILDMLGIILHLIGVFFIQRHNRIRYLFVIEKRDSVYQIIKESHNNNHDHGCIKLSIVAVEYVKKWNYFYNLYIGCLWRQLRDT